MTPAKRRAQPAADGPKRAATEDGGALLAPDGEPIARDAPATDADAASAPPTETGQVDPEDRATTQSPRRPRSTYPLPVWPD